MHGEADKNTPFRFSLRRHAFSKKKNTFLLFFSPLFGSISLSAEITYFLLLFHRPCQRRKRREKILFFSLSLSPSLLSLSFLDRNRIVLYLTIDSTICTYTIVYVYYYKCYLVFLDVSASHAWPENVRSVSRLGLNTFGRRRYVRM